MNRLLLVTILANVLPLATPMLADDNDEVTPMCRRGYFKLKLYLAPQQFALGGGLNLGAGVDQRAYCPPAYTAPPQIYSPPQYAPAAPEATAPIAVCPPDHDILRTLAVLHFLANHDARRDSDRDRLGELSPEKLALFEMFKNRSGGDEGLLNKWNVFTLQILQNQHAQIALAQSQAALLEQITAMLKAVPQPQPAGPAQLPYPYPSPETRPGSDRGSMLDPRLAPAPVPPPAPSGYRSAVPSSLGVAGRTFYKETVFRK